jgi:hypothetical protein
MRQRIYEFYRYLDELAKHDEDLKASWEAAIKNSEREPNTGTYRIKPQDAYMVYVKHQKCDEYSDEILPVITLYELIIKRFGWKTPIEDALCTLLLERLEKLWGAGMIDLPVNPAIIEKRTKEK